MGEDAEQPALQVIVLVSVLPCSYPPDLQCEEISMRSEASYVMMDWPLWVSFLSLNNSFVPRALEAFPQRCKGHVPMHQRSLMAFYYLWIVEISAFHG
jgi:hypothetical protein